MSPLKSPISFYPVAAKWSAPVVKYRNGTKPTVRRANPLIPSCLGPCSSVADPLLPPYLSPIRNERNEITHYVGVQNDISERKSIEHQLAYNSSLKVTTAKYYIPSGRCIQAVDYAKRNEDGSVAMIPDSLMKEFHTKGGRLVLDGGGISPDVTIEPNKFSNITIALMMQQTIFDFATQFAAKTHSIASPENFEISDELYNNFVAYVDGLEDFKYDSESNDLFQKLKEAAEKEAYYELGEEAFSDLEEVLKPNVTRSLTVAKDEVSELLAMELVRRYYYQRGAILYNLRFDEEIDTAVETLGNEAEYHGMLNGTVLTHAGDRRYN